MLENVDFKICLSLFLSNVLLKEEEIVEILTSWIFKMDCTGTENYGNDQNEGIPTTAYLLIVNYKHLELFLEDKSSSTNTKILFPLCRLPCIS